MWKIPLFDISFDEDELTAVTDVLKSGWLTMGDVTRSFERQFAQFIGVKHAIAVSSGTSALHLANRALDLGPDEEVICPALTFVASANSVMYTGALPVFAEIESTRNFTISPDAIVSKITRRTKAIQVMHYAGYPCDMDRIKKIAANHNLYVIEDCAHAPGAEYNSTKCGALADIGCFSYFSNKNMVTGEGGMITTNNDDIAETVRLLRSHAMTSLTLDRYRGRASSYDVVDLGHNYRLDEMRSALGIVQLGKLVQNNKKRRQVWGWYREQLVTIPKIRLPFSDFTGVFSHHIFPILLDENTDRNEFMTGLKDRGIQTSIHYPAVHLFAYYQKVLQMKPGALPLTEYVADREVTLPMYPTMSHKEVTYVCDAVAEFLS